MKNRRPGQTATDPDTGNIWVCIGGSIERGWQWCWVGPREGAFYALETDELLPAHPSFGRALEAMVSISLVHTYLEEDISTWEVIPPRHLWPVRETVQALCGITMKPTPWKEPEYISSWEQRQALEEEERRQRKYPECPVCFTIKEDRRLARLGGQGQDT